ncbi:hypothetical protein [Arenimonas alkanexedens]
MDLYRYGWVAWIWRVLAGAGLAAAGGLAWLAWRDSSPALLAIALPLASPGLLLPMVAVRIRRLGGGEIVVHTLAFLPRRINMTRLGPARLNTHAQGTVDSVHAPRLWVPVRGGLPIHIDLGGQIPDRGAFRQLFRLREGTAWPD